MTAFAPPPRAPIASVDLPTALREMLRIIDKVGGFMKPAAQDEIREARRILREYEAMEDEAEPVREAMSRHDAACAIQRPAIGRDEPCSRLPGCPEIGRKRTGRML